MFLQINWVMGTSKSTFLFFLQGHRFLIGCYLLYPGPQLEKSATMKSIKRSFFNQNEMLFFVVESFN